jgi:ferritin-like metal-binding protein YciE
MKINNLRDLFVEELQDLYDAEQQMTKALPKMAKSATTDELRNSFKSHLDQTRGQIERLDRVFETLGMKPKRKTCKAMKGLVEEGEEMMKMEIDPEVMDAALISAAQRVEHYEIAGYGCLRTYARQLGFKEAESLLQQTLDEEEATDKKLTMLAERGINQMAKRSAA